MSCPCPKEPAVRVSLFQAVVALLGVVSVLAVGVGGILTQFALREPGVNQLDNAKLALRPLPRLTVSASPPGANALQRFIDVGYDGLHGPVYFALQQELRSVTSARRLLSGRGCVVSLPAPLFPDSVLDASVVENFILEYLGVELTSPGLWGAFMGGVAAWCDSKGTPLVVYMALTTAGDVPYKEVEHVAHVLVSLGWDRQKLFRLIVETDLPQVTGVVVEEYTSTLEVPFINLAQFSHMMYYTSKVMAGPLRVLEEWYHKMGSNVRELGDITRGRAVEDPGLCEVIDSMHALEVAVLHDLADKEWSLLVRVAEAGPRGLLDAREVSALEQLLRADPKDTILCLTPLRRYAVWRMSHVYHLMGGDKERMKRAGWV